MKYGLALHTTSPELGLAISNFAGDRRSQTWNLGRDLATHLHKYLVEFIQPETWGDLGFIAVAKGPGGFTGTRLGVVTARTLAQQLNLPLFAISTLAAVAWNQHQKLENHQPIALQMPAQRGQFFVAIYEINPAASSLITLLPDTVMTPEAWQQTLAAWPTPYHLIEIGNQLGSSVTSILELAALEWQQGKHPHWSEALPYYGQHPVAEK